MQLGHTGRIWHPSSRSSRDESNPVHDHIQSQLNSYQSHTATLILMMIKWEEFRNLPLYCKDTERYSCGLRSYFSCWHAMGVTREGCVLNCQKVYNVYGTLYILAIFLRFLEMGISC